MEAFFKVGKADRLIMGMSVGLLRTVLQTLARQRSSGLIGGQHKKQDPLTPGTKIEMISQTLLCKNLIFGWRI